MGVRGRYLRRSVYGVPGSEETPTITPHPCPATGHGVPPGPAGKVLLILENEPACLSHRVTKQVDTLVQAGYGVGVITRRHPGNQSFLSRPGVRVLDYRPPRDAEHPLGYLIEYGYSFLAAAFLTFRAMLAGGVDVVQFCQPPDVYFPLAWVLRRLGVKILVDQRDLLPELYAARFGRVPPLLLAALRLSERLGFKTADRIVCTNGYQCDRALAASKLPDDHVALVRNGPVLTHVAAARSDDALKRGRTYLCCWLGAIGRQDRVDLLLHSIQQVIFDLDRKDTEFAIIGPGECLEDMRELARRLGLGDWVHFPGYLPPERLFRYLATADLGLDTSLQSDVSPVKLYEYMAFGLPVVAFDLRETRLLADGAADLTEPGDIAAHARAVDALLASPGRRRKLGQAGQERVRAELAWDHQARVYAGVIGQLAGAAPRPDPGAGDLGEGDPGTGLAVATAHDHARGGRE